MISTSLDFPTVCFRAHTPRWAKDPLSGKGASIQGGRLNRKGLHALYLSLEPETALAEYQQTSPLLPPCTMVSYEIGLARVVDFRKGFDPAHWEPLWQEFQCDWRQLWMIERIEPPSWVLADIAIQAGFTGILFQSQVSSGTNLVIFTDQLGSQDQIVLFNPNSELPKGQSSWDK